MEHEWIVWLFRGTERLIDVALAGLLIYLGFKLFLHLPDNTDAQGKVKLPGGVSIYMSRIGPGAFLALFGSVILVYSITTQVSSNKEDGDNMTYALTERARADEPMFENEWQYLEMDIAALNQLNVVVEGVIEDNQINFDFTLASKLHNSLGRIKGMMMLRHWQAEWGDPLVFNEWLTKANPENIPAEIRTACDFYFQQ